ncbi:MAG: archaellin/type IV pilin N-terminal domain-containing protein [archaeon]
MENKRGISPVIATVLLIALTIVLAGIVFLWARGFVSEQIEKSGKSVDSLCNEVVFDISKTGDKFDMSNRGDVNIFSLDIKQIYANGNSVVKPFPISLDVGKAASEEFIFDNNPQEVIIYPTLLGTVKGKSLNKPYVCIEQGKVITL